MKVAYAQKLDDQMGIFPFVKSCNIVGFRNI